VLLNLDAGEHDDEPEELWRLADIVCIACGGHAGDEASMRRVLAVARGVGAHPSYPDREHFGRRSMLGELALPDVTATIAEQCARLAALAQVTYVKPHGALYHDANASLPLAAALLDGAMRVLGAAVIVIGPPAGRLRDAALAAGLPYLREGFADRATRSDGSLLPRSEPGALVTDPAVAAARARTLRGEVDTVCVHADTAGALVIARAVREALDG
jgi:5-oxoprolinase (ATP-hydrolysing) subunit A